MQTSIRVNKYQNKLRVAMGYAEMDIRDDIIRGMNQEELLEIYDKAEDKIKFLMEEYHSLWNDGVEMFTPDGNINTDYESSINPKQAAIKARVDDLTRLKDKITAELNKIHTTPIPERLSKGTGVSGWWEWRNKRGRR